MLLSLKIENIAIIESADIEFDSGLNVLTGETGAGIPASRKLRKSRKARMRKNPKFWTRTTERVKATYWTS